jgi:cystathionine beta-lyase/cystathionine gamma-synthase
MACHCDNAEAIVRFLDEDPAADKVFYPGHDGANSHQMRRGGMVSFLAAGGESAARTVCENTTRSSPARRRFGSSHDARSCWGPLRWF